VEKYEKKTFAGSVLSLFQRAPGVQRRDRGVVAAVVSSAARVYGRKRFGLANIGKQLPSW